jgi:AcrR family transcriptional regulator
LFTNDGSSDDESVTLQPSTRRRGRALTEAIYLATLQELALTGFTALSFDKIATTAGTGKAALYRRWPGVDALVLAALTDPAIGFGHPLVPPRTGSLRTDLITLLTQFVHALGEPRGRALLPLVAHRHQHPELSEQVWSSVVRPAQDVLLAVLGDAAARGEADPARITRLSASVGPRMLLVEAWRAGSVGDDKVVEIVDEVLVPLVSA